MSSCNIWPWLIDHEVHEIETHRHAIKFFFNSDHRKRISWLVDIPDWVSIMENHTFSANSRLEANYSPIFLERREWWICLKKDQRHCQAEVLLREENFQDFEELINSEVKIIFKDQKLTPWTMNQRGDCGSLVRNGVWEGVYVKVRSMCLRVFPQLFLLIWKFTEFFLWLDVPWFNIYHIRKNQVLSSGTGLPSTTNLCFSQMKNRNQYDMSGGKWVVFFF